jgi:tetratricopeptide (TPR) repeat protein
MRTLSLLVTLVFLVVCTPALAQGTDDDLARQYYKLGEKLYNRSDYEGALKQFEKAYQYSKRPAFIYNMARCYEFMGKLVEAIRHYERFLASNPKNAEVIKARIANLKKKLQQTKPSETKPPPAGTGAGTKPTATGVTRPEPTPEPTPGPEPGPEPSPPPSRGARWMRITGWVLVGVGAASLIASIALGAKAASLSSELEDASVADPPELYSSWSDKEDQGETVERLQLVTLGVGAAAIVGGAVLVFLDMREENARRSAWIAPTPTRGGALVSGTWSF